MNLPKDHRLLCLPVRNEVKAGHSLVRPVILFSDVAPLQGADTILIFFLPTFCSYGAKRI